MTAIQYSAGEGVLQVTLEQNVMWHACNQARSIALLTSKPYDCNSAEAPQAHEHMQASTPLHEAAACGHLSIVAALLAHEADLTATDSEVGSNSSLCNCLCKHVVFVRNGLHACGHALLKGAR